MGKLCSATRRDGSPCRGPVLGDASECWAHDPKQAERRTEARKRGGQNRATASRAQRLLPRDMRPALALLFQALEEVHRGELDPRQAGAMAAVAGAIVKIYQIAEIEPRLAALEQALTPGTRWRA